jgi:protein O-mannosyl-transferase
MARRRRRERAAAPPPPPAPLAPLYRRLPFWLGTAFLFCATLALYWSALGYPRVFDDYHLNPTALRTEYAAAAANPGVLRWISVSSFWAVNELLGSAVLWQRLTNVLLHAATGALLFGFFARLFAALIDEARSRALALFGALWFVLHPVAVYGVAYIVERSIVLATLFSVLALWCVLEALIRRAPLWYAGAALAYLLAIFSKEHAVMLPAVAAALVVLVRGPSRALLRGLGAMLVVSAAIGAIVIVKRAAVIGAAYEPLTADIIGPGAIDAKHVYALSIANQALLFFRYLATWLVPWPGWMAIDVRTPFPRELLSWPYTPAFVAWLAYPFVAGWLVLRRGRAGLAGFALLWPWLLALTEMAVVRAQEPFVLYRSYLWMAGLPALLPAVVAPFGERGRTAAGALAAVVLVALIAATHERLQTFSSRLALWDDAVRMNENSKAPYAERAYVARGFAYLDQGRMAPAAADFERALELNPRSPDAHLARGTLRLRQGALPAALADFDRAIALDPRYASAYDKRCVVKAGLHRASEALPDCEKAVSLEPRDDEAWINIGVVYRALGRVPEAKAAYERALALRPSGSAHYNYGVLLLEMGRRDEAVREQFVLACRARIAAACDLLRRSR